MSEEVQPKPLDSVPETSENSDSSVDDPVVEKEEKKENIEIKVEEESPSPDPKAPPSTPEPNKVPVPKTPQEPVAPPGPVAPSGPPGPPDQQKVRISDVKINNPNDALNGLAGFVHLAQQRGVYSFEESAKIFECIKMLEDRSR
jgi:hypothetical protein